MPLTDESALTWEGRKEDIEGHDGSGPGCRPAPVPLIYVTFLRRNRSVFRDKLLYAFVWLFFLAHPVGEKTNLLLDTTDP